MIAIANREFDSSAVGHASERVARTDAGNLYSISFLVNGRRDAGLVITAETAIPYKPGGALLAEWMQSWSWRIGLRRVLAVVRNELAASVRRTEFAKMNEGAGRPRQPLLLPAMAAAEVERICSPSTSSRAPPSF